MNISIEKVWHGFLTGMGFSIAALLMIYFYDVIDGDPPKLKDSGLEIVSITKSGTKHGLLITGKVRNNGDHSWSYVYVGVNFFNDGGQFVDSCKDSLDGTIYPGEEMYFKISCGWEEKPLRGYQEYEASIVDAIFRN